MASSVRGAAFRTKPLILAKTCSIGLRFGRVFGKKQEASAGSLNGFPHGFSFMGAKIVEDDDVVGLEGWDQKLLDIGAKALAVDRTVEHAGRLDAVVAQRGEEGRGLPFALRDLVAGARRAEPSRRAVSCWSWSRSRR